MGIRAKWVLAGVVLFIIGASTEGPLFMLLGFIAILAAIFCDKESLAFQDGVLPPRAVSPGPCQVRLTSVGRNRIGVIRIVRQFTGLSLIEARNLVESAPVEVVSGISEQDACDMKEALEQQGAVVVTSAVGKEAVDSEHNHDNHRASVNMFHNPELWSPGPYKAVLVDPGQNKIEVIKLTRRLFGFGLKEAMELVDSCPTLLIDEVSLEIVQFIKDKYTAEGAKVAASRGSTESSDDQSSGATSNASAFKNPTTESRFLPGTSTVTLLDAGPHKSEILWILHTLLGFSNQTSEQKASQNGSVITSGISESDAVRIKRILESEGATVSVLNQDLPIDRAITSSPSSDIGSQKIQRRNRLK